MYAFERAVNLGVDVLECDIWPTLDGVWVIHHDETIDRTSDGTGRISEINIAELAKFDFAYRFDPQQDQRFPLRGQGIRLPRLEQLLRDFDHIPFSIEVKSSQVKYLDELVQLVRDFNAQDRVVFASFHDEVIETLRTLDDSLMTSPTRRETKFHLITQAIGMDRLHTPKSVIYQLPSHYQGRDILTPSFINSAHQNGQLVWAWTIDDPAEAQRLIDLGVDGLMSNRPDLMLKVLGRMPNDEVLHDSI